MECRSSATKFDPSPRACCSTCLRELGTECAAQPYELVPPDVGPGRHLEDRAQDLAVPAAQCHGVWWHISPPPFKDGRLPRADRRLLSQSKGLASDLAWRGAAGALCWAPAPGVGRRQHGEEGDGYSARGQAGRPRGPTPGEDLDAGRGTAGARPQDPGLRGPRRGEPGADPPGFARHPRADRHRVPRRRGGADVARCRRRGRPLPGAHPGRAAHGAGRQEPGTLHRARPQPRAQHRDRRQQGRVRTDLRLAVRL